METKIIACKPKKEFAFYYIKQLLKFNFDRKPQLSTIRLPLVLVLLALLLSTSSLLVVASTNIFIYSMQLSGIGPTFIVYSTLALYISNTKLILRIYMQLSGTNLVSTINTTSKGYNQPVYTLLSKIKSPLFTTYMQP